MEALLEKRLHRAGREVATADQPLVVLLDAQHPGEADQRGVVGEDPDDVGAPSDLLVEALKRSPASRRSVAGAGSPSRVIALVPDEA
jgi:hypothetical protein